MRSVKILISAIIIICIAGTSTYAQEQDRVGIGFGYSSSGALGIAGSKLNIDDIISPVSIYLPMTFGNFRLEPEIGYVRSSASGDEQNITFSTFQLGTGLFALNRISDKTNFYYGGRLGFIRQSSEIALGEFDIDTESDSSTNFFLGPAMGAEHMLGDHFSVGGEAQLLYTSIDNEDEIDTSLIQTRATLFLRIHF